MGSNNLDPKTSPRKNLLQLPASAGSKTIKAPIHRAIQIKKFLPPEISVVFTVHPF
jgi:hypothetical protein